MDFTFLLLFSANILAAQAHGLNINRIIELIQRRNLLKRYGSPILGVPRYPEELPEAEPIHPGHTLLRPSQGMLKSSVKFPLRDFGGLVYGNLDNLGITYGKTNERTLYTDFRKSNNLLDTILRKLQSESNSKATENKPPIIVIEINNAKKNNANYEYSKKHLGNPEPINEEENKANEILDDFDNLLGTTNDNDYRRMKRRKKSKYRNRSTNYESSSSGDSTSSGSSDYEKNPGNPYSVHKNKYVQNWLSKHDMDGDHMNIVPLAPKMNVLGPSGADLFFGRKWWYFNQDDYKPMG